MRRPLLRRFLLAQLGMVVLLCAAAASAQAYVYWVNPTDPGMIGRVNLDGSGLNSDFITAGNTPQGVAVDGNYVYWTNFNDGTIGRANLDGTGVDQNFITGASYPRGVAVDGAHIYWTNAGTDTIGRANLDGTGADESFISDVEQGSVLAVGANYVYWTNYNAGTIGRAKLDGSAATNNFITGITNPVGIAVDSTYVYWAAQNNSNPAAGTIGRANLDSTGVDQNFITGIDEPSGIAVDSSYIYWTSDSIGRANVDGSDVETDFADGQGVALAVDGLGPGHSLSQGSPMSATVASGVGYTGQLTVTNPSGTVTYTETPSADSREVVVSSTGAISAPSTLAAATYTVSGTDSDDGGDSGTWSFTLTVLPPGTHVLSQGSPMSATVQLGTGYSGQLTVTNPSGTVTYTETPSADSGEVIVSARGAISASSALGVGTYTVSGTDSDAAGDSGSWGFTLTVAAPSSVCLDYGVPLAPPGYVVTGVFVAPSCGYVYSNLGYNAVFIALPSNGLIMCQLDRAEVRVPAGYVVTHVYPLGGPVTVGRCGSVSYNFGFNATQIEHPSDGLLMCVLSPVVSLPSGYVPIAVGTDTGGAAPDSFVFGGCGRVFANVGYNEVSIALPRDGQTICALAGAVRVPSGYVVTEQLNTALCGPVYENGFNTAVIELAPSTPALDTRGLIGNSAGDLSPMVSCPPPASGCSGTLELAGSVGAGASDATANAARAALPKLAEATFTIPAGSTVVNLRLNARARRALAHAHTLRARAILTIRPNGGASRTAAQTVTIRAGGLDSEQIKTRLRAEIKPRGKTAKIHALLTNHGYSLHFTPPTAGRVVIDWYQMPSTTGSTRGGTLIASGVRSFRRAGLADVRIGLTAGGRRALKGARQLLLTAVLRFVPAGEYPVTLTRTFTLRR